MAGTTRLELATSAVVLARILLSSGTSDWGKFRETLYWNRFIGFTAGVLRMSNYLCDPEL